MLLKHNILNHNVNLQDKVTQLQNNINCCALLPYRFPNAKVKTLFVVDKL